MPTIEGSEWNVPTLSLHWSSICVMGEQDSGTVQVMVVLSQVELTPTWLIWPGAVVHAGGQDPQQERPTLFAQGRGQQL